MVVDLMVRGEVSMIFVREYNMTMRGLELIM